jgi:hypothetical protein
MIHPLSSNLMKTFMKLNFTIILLVMICFAVKSQSPDRYETKQSIENFTTVVNNEKSSWQAGSGSWYDQARQKIREQEYNIKWKTGLEEFVAVNRRNQIGFYFQPDGYRVVSFSSDDSWEFGFKLKSIQRNKNQVANSSRAKTNQSGHDLVYHYPDYSIEYRNDSNGMRQNFIVRNRLDGNGSLEIVIALQGKLTTSLDEKGGLVLSRLENGQRKAVLHYDQLKVWDKNNRQLEAIMELQDSGRTLVLKVNDENAVYPVTVDPLNHIPDWSGNGLGVLPSLDVLYGSTVSDAGDVNNDGFDDIIIGAPANIDVLSNSVIASTGQAFIYLGSPSGLSVTPDITLQSSVAINALFGYSVSSAGDINNDGYDDVVIGAPGDMVTLDFGFPFGSIANNVGKAYIYYGNSSPALMPGSVVTVNLRATDFLGVSFGITLNPLFGFSVSGAGDVNNDGYDDVVVGSPLYTDLGTLTLAGRATIYLGSNTGLNTASPIHRNAGLLSNALFGFSVSSAGDMNNDGADEVVIGAPGALSLLPGLAGRVYVYSGISSPTPGGISSLPTTYSSGALLSTLFGFSVSNAGDVNNDGYGDIVVGQPATLSLNGLVTVGQANVFFGSGSLSNKSVSDVTLRSPRDPDILSLLDGNLLFGFSVSGGTDLDCDGIDDIIVGEPGGTSLTGLTGINALSGQAYIFYGKNTSGPASSPGWNLNETGSLTVANMVGYSVSPAGDVNGDGRADLLIGAANGTLNLSNILSGIINFAFVQSVGSAHVYHGCVMPTIFTLPVELINFSGYLQNNVTTLNWKTETEENSSHFEIERSVNNRGFEKIGAVAASFESTTIVDYRFYDNGPQQGSNAYRLRIVDKDGGFTFSKIVLINNEAAGYIRLQSNMVSSDFELEFNNAANGSYSIEVLSMDGIMMQRDRVDISARTNVTKGIALRNTYSSGIYIVRIQNSLNQQIQTLKMRVK